MQTRQENEEATQIRKNRTTNMNNWNKVGQRKRRDTKRKLMTICRKEETQNEETIKYSETQEEDIRQAKMTDSETQ